MRLNEYGKNVKAEWLRTAAMRASIEIDEFVVMPSHLHGIIVIRDCRGTLQHAPADEHAIKERFGQPTSNSVPAILRGFKCAATKCINILRNSPGTPVWQRGYYEHVIRNEEDLNAVREYIRYNPAKGVEDEENPRRISS